MTADMSQAGGLYDTQFVQRHCFCKCQGKLRATLCGLVAWLQVAYIVLPAWSRCACAWIQPEIKFVLVCGLVSACSQVASSLVTQCACAWIQFGSNFVCSLLLAWSHCACAWTQCESMSVWACGLVSVCLQSVSSLVTL